MSHKEDQVENFEKYLLNEGHSTSTMTSYLSDLKVFARWFKQTNGLELNPPVLTMTDLKDYRAYMKSVEQAAPATINRRLASIRAYAKCYKVQLDIKGVTEQQLAPRSLDRRQVSAVMRELEKAELAARTEFAKMEATRNKDIVVVLLNTGLRISELCNLQPDDIVLGERSGSVTIRYSKGEKSRQVPLNKNVRKALQSLEIPLAISVRTIQRMVEETGRRAGVEVTPHQLRHTCLKTLIDLQVDIDKVAAIAGHEDLNTTKRYIIPSQQDLVKAMSALDD
jgi:integrase/recombinase XerC